MDYEIDWTGPALAQLEAAIRYIATDSVEAAEQVRADLFHSVEVLRRFPQFGAKYEADPSGRTREILCHKYRIFYRVREAHRRIEIVTVWHASRQEPRLPR